MRARLPATLTGRTMLSLVLLFLIWMATNGG